jgi:hypothetical protein
MRSQFVLLCSDGEQHGLTLGYQIWHIHPFQSGVVTRTAIALTDSRTGQVTQGRCLLDLKLDTW